MSEAQQILWVMWTVHLLSMARAIIGAKDWWKWNKDHEVQAWFVLTLACWFFGFIATAIITDDCLHKPEVVGWVGLTMHWIGFVCVFFYDALNIGAKIPKLLESFGKFSLMMGKK